MRGNSKRHSGHCIYSEYIARKRRGGEWGREQARAPKELSHLGGARSGGEFWSGDSATEPNLGGARSGGELTEGDSATELNLGGARSGGLLCGESMPAYQTRCASLVLGRVHVRKGDFGGCYTEHGDDQRVHLRRQSEDSA